jgi:hypothetical protein
MERADQDSPLPADPAGREDIMSDEQARREDISRDEPDETEGGTARAAGEGSPMSPDPARREDVIRGAEQPGGPAAGG